MKEWKFDKAEMEPWDLGCDGWTNERASGFITSLVQDTLVLEVLAWTPGTKEAVAGDAVRLDVPSEPSLKDIVAYLASVQS